MFDRPKTVVTDFDAQRPTWHQTLAQAAIDFGFAIELCAARSPEQKGAVENLVGLVKRRVFHARSFADLETDLPRQLLEWLAVPPSEYGLRGAVHVGPTALVDLQGVLYTMAAGACGIPATLHVNPDRVRIVTVGGRFEAAHARFPEVGETNYLAGQTIEESGFTLQ